MLPDVAMESPVSVTFRNTGALPEIESLVRREAAKLERYGPRLVSCRMAIEEPPRHPRAGNRYRVRLEVGAGLSKPIVVTREPGDAEMRRDLRTIVLDVFRAARRRLQSSRERVRGPERAPAEPRGLIERLVPSSEGTEGYGFLRSLDGRAIDEGPQASTVAIVSKPGVRAAQPAADRRRGQRGRRPAPA